MRPKIFISAEELRKQQILANEAARFNHHMKQASQHYAQALKHIQNIKNEYEKVAKVGQDVREKEKLESGGTKSKIIS